MAIFAAKQFLDAFNRDGKRVVNGSDSSEVRSENAPSAAA
ncbi:hypothetical protein PR003_g35155 [Phytophthora rubi]|uniref:Uncharacterized protein n=1 Tax=Phytophthora rubi TaxID=129364 RepID=A0A6A3G1V7_9STRA|nr:hypothetical protein PR001_g34084 [Phytophthora rubi]KAE9258574.1 hypothetical protein PR003_g35155 [Phytophthora rubi]